MATIMPFDFLWCYEPEDDDEAEHCDALLLGTPETVTPLHIDISNILSDKTIRLHAIEGVTAANANHYHFKLSFPSGILVEPEKIGIATPNWSLYQDANNLYLLWTGEEICLNFEQVTEVILTGVAAQAAVRTTTTNVTISWQFKQGTIDVINISRIPGQSNEYAANTTLTLEMIKTSGKSNIPLYVGFVGANKVMNTHNETSSLQLRITNTNLPGIDNPDITFHYNTDAAQCSQLVIVLEVGGVDNVPWALGTKDQVNNIEVALNEQWQKKGNTEEIKVGDTVKALQWTFIPKSADVVLHPQETLLINLNGIQTAHPTGEANLYLRYQYIEGYKDGQFTCQIEKAPLVFDNKVRIGTTRNLNGILTVKDGISLDGGKSEIQHVGPFTFHSDVDGNGDGSSAKFCKGTENTLLMELTSGGNLNLNQGDLNFSSRHGQRINLWGNKANGIGLQSYTTYFRTSRNFAWFKDGDHNDDEINPGENGIVQMAINDGNVGIGTASPSAKLEVNGRIKDATGWVIPVGTIVPYAGSTAPQGWLLCNGQSFDKSTYSELYNVLGEKDHVPNLKARFIVGVGDGYSLNNTGGEKLHKLTISEMPSHNHNNGDYKYLSKVNGEQTSDHMDSTSGEPNLKYVGAMKNSGGNQPHENRPPYYALNYIIKA